MARKLSFIITADNNPAIKALSQISVSLNKINSSFKMQTKIAGKGSGGALDPKALNGVGEELRKVNSIFKSMGAAQNQWERDAGFTNLQKAFKGTAQSANELKSVVGELLGPVMALTGVGGVGAVAGIAKEWAGLANQIKLANYETGMSQGTIQSWMGVGKSFGIQAQDMAAGLKGFSQMMEDVAYGRNNAMMAFFSRSDIGIKNIRERMNAGDIDGLLKETYAKLQKFSPVVRSQMLDSANLGFMKPMMMYGPDEFNKRMAVADKYQYVASQEEINRALDYQRALFGLDMALDVFHRNISDKIMPQFQPVVQWFSDWIVKADAAKTIMEQLSVVVGVTFVGAIALLGRAMLASPLGRFIVLADAAVNMSRALGEWKPFQGVVAEGMSLWNRFHPGNFGTGKSMMESQSDYEKRMGYSMTGIAAMGSPVSSGAGDISSGISISGNAPPQKHELVVNFNNAPPGMKATPSPAPGTSMPVNINYSGFQVP